MDNNDVQISYQNKDIMLKHFAERLRGHNLGVFGLNNMKIIEVLPTNLPTIEANELRLDNLFRLSDGSFAIVDYESKYSEANKLKYLGYIERVEKKLYNEFHEIKPIKVIVIYSADVEPGTTNATVDAGGLRLEITEVFLLGLDSDRIKKDLETKLCCGESLVFEDMMRLVIYPLTYKGDEAKKKAVSDAIGIAERISDARTMVDALTGILVFSDKVIAIGDAERIRRRISMLKVWQLIEDEKEMAVKAAISEDIRIFIQDKLEDNISEDVIKGKLVRLYNMTEQEADGYLKEFSATVNA